MAFVDGVRFFDMWYLRPDYEQEFDPMFYDDDPLEDAEFHYDILEQWGLHRTNIAIAPRGSAKSYLVRKACLFRLTSADKYSIIYATSTGDNAKMTGQSLKDQFTNNQRINDDFGPECRTGRLVPRRGEATFGTQHFQLQNGSYFRAISAESKMRGGRPKRFVLDDPEYDPKASTSMQLIRDYMDRLLFKMVLPMVMRAGSGVDWLATFVSKRHYAWHAMDVTESPDGGFKSIDPRFNLWSRIMVRAEYNDPETGQIRSCWPAMWPATKQERMSNPEYHDRVSLEEIKETIGLANYLAEYMGKPGEGDDIYFPELEPEKHGYFWEDVDVELQETPWRSRAKIRYYDMKLEDWVIMPVHTFWNSVRSRMFMTVDTSYSSGPSSDSKVACLMATDHLNNLFVLDLWSSQCVETELVTQVFKMADKWRCPVVWPETVREGLSIYNALFSVVRTRAQEDLTGVTHLPAIKKLNPGRTEKTAKIASLLLRFNHGKIKLPIGERQNKSWRKLFNQIEEFNPDAPDGGLQHDDEIDCVAMSQYVMRGRANLHIPEVEKKVSPEELLLSGRPTDDLGRHPGLGIDWRNADPQFVGELFARRNAEVRSDGNGKTKV